MKTKQIIIWLLLSQAAMGLTQLDTENADRDLTSQVTVLTHTPSATVPMQCQGLVYLGDGVKNLSGTSGTFRVEITIGGQTLQPNPQNIYFTTATRSCVYTSIFPVPANAEVVIKALSPVSTDTDVDITAYLYDVGSVNVTEISGDTTAADNLELMYDTTGYIDNSAPASRDQIAALAGGVSVKQVAESSTVTQGTETNTYVATQVHDATDYIVTDSGAGAGIDFYLQFDIGSNATPVEFHMHGYYDEAVGATNSLAIQAYNFNLAAWQTIQTITNAVSEQSYDLSLTTVNVNDDNEVRINFVQGAQEASSTMNINHAEVGYVTSPVTAAEMADAVWDELIADHTSEPSFGGEVGGLDPNLTLVLADTDELQQDWTDGGRLDLLVDAIKYVTDRLFVLDTTVAGPNDANQFSITAGLDVNDVYDWHLIRVTDADDGHAEVRWIEDYYVSREVFVDEPFGFVPAAGDEVQIMSTGYGGWLWEMLTSLSLSKIPVYYFSGPGTTGGTSESAAGVTHIDQSGADPP